MTVAEFLTLLFLAAANAGITVLSRALPWPTKWLQVKPWNCAACWPSHCAYITLGCAWVAGYTPALTWMNAGFYWMALAAPSMVVFKTIYPPDIVLPE